MKHSVTVVPVTGLNSESTIYMSTTGLNMWHILESMVKDIDIRVWKYLKQSGEQQTTHCLFEQILNIVIHPLSWIIICIDIELYAYF